MTKEEGVTLLRQWIAELNTDRPVTDAVLMSDYIDPSLRRVNDLIGYNVETTTSTKDLLVIEAGEPVVTLPSDFVGLVYFQFGENALLSQTDMQDVRSQNIAWPAAKPGITEQVMVYGNVLEFYPAPTAELIELGWTMRYVRMPKSFAEEGFGKLQAQHHDIPLLGAARLWFMAQGQDANFARAEQFNAMFKEAIMPCIDIYEQRKQVANRRPVG